MILDFGRRLHSFRILRSSPKSCRLCCFMKHLRSHSLTDFQLHVNRHNHACSCESWQSEAFRSHIQQRQGKFRLLGRSMMHGSPWFPIYRPLVGQILVLRVWFFSTGIYVSTCCTLQMCCCYSRMKTQEHLKNRYARWTAFLCITLIGPVCLVSEPCSNLEAKAEYEAGAKEISDAMAASWLNSLTCRELCDLLSQLDSVCPACAAFVWSSCSFTGLHKQFSEAVGPIHCTWLCSICIYSYIHICVSYINIHIGKNRCELAWVRVGPFYAFRGTFIKHTQTNEFQS